MVAAIEAKLPRVLFIDAYDSFTYNIVSVVECYLGVEVTVIKIDDSIGDLASYLRPFSAVIAGPGPGHPDNPKDAGLFQELWSLGTRDILPVLGICLGFQSLVLAYGGKILQLVEPRHGMLRKVRAGGDSLFTDIRCITAVQYHSLYAQIGDFVNEDVTKDSFEFNTRFESICQDLVPLAWDFEADNRSEDIGLQRNNPKAILMGVAHRTKPYYGVQFHPESICSNEEARRILPNWWALAQQWNRSHRHHFFRNNSLPSVERRYTIKDSRSLQGNPSSKAPKPASNASCKNLPMGLLRTMEAPCNSNVRLNGHYKSNYGPRSSSRVDPSYKVDVITQTADCSHFTVPDVCERLGLQDGELVVMDSECSQNPQTGKHSIIGILGADSVKLEYNIGQCYVRHTSQRKTTVRSLNPHGGSIFAYLKYYMGQRKAKNGASDVPFWGGLVGYITYEACLETLDIKSTPNPIDLSFAVVERSVVINHQQGMLYVQSIRHNDHDWVASVASMLSARVPPTPFNEAQTTSISTATTSIPDESLYKRNIRECFDFLRRGDSYELCLTTECRVRLPKDVSSWALFRRLRRNNAAPFAAYMRLGPLTHVASSPERFMSWSRPARQKVSHVRNGDKCGQREGGDGRLSSTFQFRPIKGTVTRQPKDRALPAISLEQAAAILSTPKERAENLMIVDLIRHDLHRVVGSGNVNVSKLMVVESYATLYQLVSIVEGTLYLNDSEEDPDDERNYGSAAAPDDDYLKSNNKSSMSHKRLSAREDYHDYSAIPKAPVRPSSANILNGIDVLATSLPPGSMTGAPKRRSCSILQQIERRNRGVYAGVLGYLDVGGGGDFSVVIRSAFKWDSPATHPSSDSGSDREGARYSQQNGDAEQFGTTEDIEASVMKNGQSKSSLFDSVDGLVAHPDRGHDHEREHEKSADSAEAPSWVIGAGGAVTVLSTEDGEWDEMHGKLSSTLAAFVDCSDNDENSNNQLID